MAFQSLLPPRQDRVVKKSNSLAGAISDFFSLLNLLFSPQIIFVLGAAVQGLLVAILPKKYALTPALLILVIHTIDTLLVTVGWKANPYLKGVLPKKTTAQVLDEEGNFEGPGEEKIAVLLLGVKSNHPLGIFAPDFSIVNAATVEMNAELEAGDPQKTGYLGHSDWVGKDANGNQELLSIYYWRSIEHVHAFAHTEVHKKAWQWWDRTLPKHAHIGFMHEVFEAPKGLWESIYINYQPSLMGKVVYRTIKEDESEKDGNGQEFEWASGVMDATKGLMRTSNGRRGLTGPGVDADKFGKNYYVS